MAAVLVSLASRFPKGSIKRFLRYLKNQVRCFLYNRDRQANFTSCYVRDHFVFRFADFTVKFYDDCHYELKLPLLGYQKEHALKAGETVVDGGAYVGAFTIVAARMVTDTGRVLAFEPDTVSYERLNKNIALNDLRNVTTVQKGLWSTLSTCSFSDDHSAGSAIVSGQANDSITIEVSSLDEELKRQKIKAVDFVKMDIEGAELEAVKGCLETMSASKPDFAIASYHTVDGAQSFHALEAWFSGQGYRAMTEFPVHLTTYARPK